MIARIVYNPSFSRSAFITKGAASPTAFVGVGRILTPRGAKTLIRTGILASIPTTNRGPIAVSSGAFAPLRTCIDRNVLTFRTFTASCKTAFCVPRCTTGDAPIRAIHRVCAFFSTRIRALCPVASRGPARTAPIWTTTGAGNKFGAGVTLQTIVVFASLSRQAGTNASAPRLANLWFCWFCCGNQVAFRADNAGIVIALPFPKRSVISTPLRTDINISSKD